MPKEPRCSNTSRWSAMSTNTRSHHSPQQPCSAKHTGAPYSKTERNEAPFAFARPIGQPTYPFLPFKAPATPLCRPDLILRVGGRDLHVHKAVLRLASPVFDELISSKEREQMEWNIITPFSIYSYIRGPKGVDHYYLESQSLCSLIS